MNVIAVGTAEQLAARLDAGEDARRYTYDPHAVEEVMIVVADTLAIEDEPVHKVRLLAFAAALGDMEKVQVLVDRGALRGARVLQSESTYLALHAAILQGNLPMVQLLVQSGVDPYAVVNGMSSVATASLYGTTDILQWLLQDAGLDAGADTGAVNADPLVLTVLLSPNPRVPAIELLLAHGASVFQNVRFVAPTGTGGVQITSFLSQVTMANVSSAVMALLLRSSGGTAPNDDWMRCFGELVEQGDEGDVMSVLQAQTKLQGYHYRHMEAMCAHVAARGREDFAAALGRALFVKERDPRRTLVQFRSTTRPPILAERRRQMEEGRRVQDAAASAAGTAAPSAQSMPAEALPGVAAAPEARRGTKRAWGVSGGGAAAPPAQRPRGFSLAHS